MFHFNRLSFYQFKVHYLLYQTYPFSEITFTKISRLDLKLHIKSNLIIMSFIVNKIFKFTLKPIINLQKFNLKNKTPLKF